MKYSQDFELWLRASSRFKIFSINRNLVSIRIHNHRISNDNKGSNQIIYSRACLLAYWLSKDYRINYSQIYSKEKWEIFLLEVTSFISKYPYYLGRKSYVKITEGIKKQNILSKFKYFIFNFYNLNFFLIRFMINQELFLRKNHYYS